MLGGIQLPALCGCRARGGSGGAWRPPWARQLRLAEPAPQRRLMGQRVVGMLLGQLGADQPGAPARVRPAQGHGVRVERLGVPGAAPTTGGIVRRPPGPTTVAVAPPQGAHRPRSEPALLRDGGQQTTARWRSMMVWRSATGRARGMAAAPSGGKHHAFARGLTLHPVTSVVHHIGGVRRSSQWGWNVRGVG